MLVLDGEPFVESTVDYVRRAQLGNAHYPLTCRATVDELVVSPRPAYRAVLEGLTSVRMAQSVCSFDGLAISLVPSSSVDGTDNATFTPEVAVRLRVCANTSSTLDPHLRPSACNSTVIHVASCPARTASGLFNVSGAVASSLFPRGVASGAALVAAMTPAQLESAGFVATAVGYHFPWRLRHSTFCALKRPDDRSDGSVATVARVQARWLHGCAVECVFDADTVHRDLFGGDADAGFRGFLGIEFSGSTLARRSTRVASSCPGSPLMMAAAADATTTAAAAASAIAREWAPSCATAAVALALPSAVDGNGCPVVIRGTAHAASTVITPPSGEAFITNVTNRTSYFDAQPSAAAARHQRDQAPIGVAFCSRRGTRAAYRTIFNDWAVAGAAVDSSAGAEAAFLKANFSIGLPNASVLNVTTDVDGTAAAVWAFAFDETSASKFTRIDPPLVATANATANAASAAVPGMSWTPACGADGLPMLFEPRAAFGWGPTAGAGGGFVVEANRTSCITIARSFISTLTIATRTDDPDAFPFVADTVSPFPVPLTLLAQDEVGANVTTLADPLLARVHFEAAYDHVSPPPPAAPGNGSSGAPPASSVIIRDLGPSVTVSIAAFPFVLNGITFPAVAARATIRVVISAVDNPQLGNVAGAVADVSHRLFDDEFPGTKAIAVSYCPPSAKLQQGLTHVTAVYNTTDATPGCVARPGIVVSDAIFSQPLSQAFPVSPSGNPETAGNGTAPSLLPDGSTVVEVSGGLFDWHRRAGLRCHYASADDPWTVASNGTGRGFFVSSCRVRCVVPAQPDPIRAGSADAVVAGQVVRRDTLPAAVRETLGQLRVLQVERQDDAAPPASDASSSSSSSSSSVGGWSLPIAVDVIGPGTQLSLRDWGSFAYSRQFRLALQPISIEVADALGTSLVGLDPRLRSVAMTSRGGTDLNASGVVAAAEATCAPSSSTTASAGAAGASAGLAVFSSLVLQDPKQGEYALAFDSPGLEGAEALLRIEASVEAYAHRIEFLGYQPLPYTDASQTLSGEGLLPVQPEVGIFRRDPATGAAITVVDANVSDVRVVAEVAPLDPNELPDPANGVGLTVCTTAFGNCAFLFLGVAAFETLRFVGVPGHSYNVSIRSENRTLDVLPASFVVTVPRCDGVVLAQSQGGSAIAAQLQPPVNATLAGRPGGLAVTGGRFPPPTSFINLSPHMLRVVAAGELPAPVHPHGSTPLEYTCGFGTSSAADNQAIFPAAFMDVCNVRCFAEPPGGGNTAAPAFANVSYCRPIGNDTNGAARSSVGGNCCFDRVLNATRCSEPLEAPVRVLIPARLVLREAAAELAEPASAGLFSYIGPPTQLVVAYTAAPRALAYNAASFAGREQIAVSAAAVSPAPVQLELRDAAGQFVGSTDRAHRRPLHVTSVTWWPHRVRGVPSNESEIRRFVGAPANDTSCLHVYRRYGSGSETGGVNVTADVLGNATTALVDGAATIRNVTLPFPVAGSYEFTLTAFDPANASRRDFATVFRLRVLPGRPVAACMYNSLAGIEAQNATAFIPQPQVLLLDASGNVYQPLRRSGGTDDDDSTTPPTAVPPSATSANGGDTPTPSSSSSSSADTNNVVDVVPDFPAMTEAAAVAARLAISVSLWERPLTASAGEPFVLVSRAMEDEHDAASAVPSADYAELGQVTLVYFGFKQLAAVGMRFGYEYTMQFAVSGLAAVTTPAPHSTTSAVPASLVLANTMARATSLEAEGGELVGLTFAPNGGEAAPTAGSVIVAGSMTLRRCGDTEYGVAETDTCLTCPSGPDHCVGASSADDTSRLRCFACNGSTVLLLTAGYWRASVTATTAYKCSPPEACPASASALGDCGARYEPRSPLCSVCRAGFAPNIIGECQRCASDFVNWVALAIFLLLAGLLIGVVVFITMKEDAMPDSDHNLVILSKIFISFVQVVGTLGEFEVNLPSIVAFYYRIVRASSGGSGVSVSPINCLFPAWTFLDRLVLQLGAPPALLFALAVLLLVRGLLRRRAWHAARKEALKQQLQLSALGQKKPQQPYATGDSGNSPPPIFSRHAFVTFASVFLYLQFQTVLTHCIEVLRCREIVTGDPRNPVARVLRLDARVSCGTNEYATHAAAALYGIFVYGAGLPLVAMLICLVVADRQGWFTANERMSFLIKGFRLRYWFWEFVVVFRKALLRAILAIVDDGTLQALAGIWAMTALFVIHAYCGPYVRALHNRVEGLALLTFVVTLNVGLLFQSAGLGREGECNAACVIVAVCLAVVNIAVLGYFVFVVGRTSFERIVELYGVDDEHGDRRVSWRNVRREVYSSLGLHTRLTPSFRTYRPPIQDRGLALQLLGEEGAAAAAGDAAGIESLLQDDEYEMMELGSSVNNNTNKRPPSSRASSGGLGGGSSSPRLGAEAPPAIPLSSGDSASTPSVGQDGSQPPSQPRLVLPTTRDEDRAAAQQQGGGGQRRGGVPSSPPPPPPPANVDDSAPTLQPAPKSRLPPRRRGASRVAMRPSPAVGNDGDDDEAREMTVVALPPAAAAAAPADTPQQPPPTG